MQLTFCGAARNVTGSCYHLDLGDTQLLVDCGLYQERSHQDRNWEPFPFDAAAIDAVILTHAHIDHCGRLPLLAKQGFKGKVYTTHASADLTELLVLDSAHIQEEDARFKSKRHRREGRDLPDAEPLYGTSDAKVLVDHLRGVEYHRPVEVARGVTALWNDAGHMLGSGHVEVDIQRNGTRRRLVFSGDIGMSPRPILKDPEPFVEADLVICESTYGDRLHEDRQFAVDTLREVINSTLDRGGNVVMPAFAVGRTQTVLYFMRELMEQKQIPPVTTFVDSPMAVHATEILRRHAECYDAEARAVVEAGHDPVGFQPLHFTPTTDASKAINRIRGGCVIISAAGMCNAGRIKHHLLHNIGRPEATILFTGYQAQHTLGRHILDGEPEVRILGEMKRVKARIEKINGLSGHADRDQLLAWLRAFKQPPQHAYITHGEEEVAIGFAELVTRELGWSATAPEYRDVVEL